MHELAVTQGILQVVLETAELHHARRVTEIELVIGALTSIVDDSVQFYFDLLSRETLAEGARLRFRRQAAEATCQACGERFDVTPPLTASCPHCGDYRLKIGGGDQFYVASIDIDEEPTAP